MAEIKQIYEIVNLMAEQALGLKGLQPTDATFVSVGNEVLKSDQTVDAWNKVLADRIARTAICIREYAAADTGLHKEGIEYGIALQRIYIDFTQASENTTWRDKDTEHSDPFRKNAPGVKQKIFSKISTWEHDITVPDRQISTAFTSATAMGAFISGLHVEFQNTITSAYEEMADLCRAAGVALWHTSGHSVNLLANYNTQMGTTLTAAECLNDREFLRYAACQINLAARRIRRMSTLFNLAGRRTFTPEDKRIITVLDEYASHAAFYLESDTYHDELVKLPGYHAIPYWQGSGIKYAFDSTSAVDVKINYNGADENVKLSGILAMIHDNDAMGTTIDNRRIKTVRNDADEYTNYFAKADIGYFTDGNFNGIVFYVADGTVV